MRLPSVKVVFSPEVVTRKVKPVIRRFLAMVGAEYAKGVQMRMKNSPATGRVYRRGGVTHRASAKGEAPKPDTGALVKSVRFHVKADGPIPMVEIGSTKKYALPLEYGAAKLTRPPARVRRRRRQTGREARWILFPRPSWGPELESIRRRLPDLMRRAARRGR